MPRNKALIVLSWNTCWNIYIIVICTGALSKSTLATNSLLSLKSVAGGPGVNGFIVPGDDSECSYDCKDAERRLYCGSNGHTFNSECLANKSVCEDPDLTVTPGKCDDSNRCIMERNYYYEKMRSSVEYMQPVNIPACTKSGDYASTQCSMILEYCWCVTTSGKMIKNSTFTIESNQGCGKRKTRNKSKKRCDDYTQKAAFALKLRERILYESRRGPQMRRFDIIAAKHIKKDRDKDGNLNAKEIKSLLRAYRKQLPRACSKFFLKFCDIDQDKKVSIDELSICLGVDPFRKKRMVPDPAPVSKNKGDDIITTRPTISDGPYRKPGTSPDDKIRVCRQVRLELIRSKRDDVIIPDCEGPNDKYWTPVQCYREPLIEYCFCVVRETGTPIPKTSVEHDIPDCQLANLSANVSVPIPGCPPRHKSKFLRAVLAFILQKAHEAGVLTARGNSTLTDKEFAAQWYFDVTDKNRDRFLTRKENKNLKKILQKHKVPKKCLRKFSQHCDRNKDKKTSKEEFVACLEVRKLHRPLSRDMSVTISKLKTTEDTDNN